MAPPKQLPAPLWKAPRGLSLAHVPAALDATSLYFFISRSDLANRGTPQATVVEKNGRHADLVCLVPGCPEPLFVPVKFDPLTGPVPISKHTSFQSTTWMDCSSDSLFIGESDLPGAWRLPKSEIKAELDRQIQKKRLEKEK
jgi:hypothetical protein